MLADIVEFGNVVESHLTILVHIEFVIGTFNPNQTILTQVSPQRSNELVKADSTRSVSVEFGKNSLGLILVEVDSKIFKSIEKLTQVHLSVSIIIEDAEDTADAANGHRTTA